jgi:hypothetical protein
MREATAHSLALKEAQCQMAALDERNVSQLAEAGHLLQDQERAFKARVADLERQLAEACKQKEVRQSSVP